MCKEGFVGLTTFIVLCLFSFHFFGCSKERPIKVGILHSLTGTMAVSGQSVCDATLLAIEEINEKGGLLGRKIEPVIADGKSDWQIFKEKAEWLITEEKVSVVFGCWTSSSRKTVKPVFEKHDHLLFYPVQYEGLESSPNIFYTGSTPSQQVIPAIKWVFDNIGKTFFLVGSDYIFPRAVNIIIKDQITALGGSIIGEEYVPLGSTAFSEIVEKIIKIKPDIIINTINGSSNLSFFTAMAHNKSIPILSFSVSENEINALHSKVSMTGNYASWNYFESIDSPVNRKFVEVFKNKYGQGMIVDDPMESAYFGVKLWAKTVEAVGSSDPVAVRNALPEQRFNAPEGMVYIDKKNNHTWKTVRIGKINRHGKFDIVWTSQKPVHPIPYPIYRSKSEWDKMISGIYEMWGGQWSNSCDNKSLINQRIAEITPLIRRLSTDPVLVSEIKKAGLKTGPFSKDRIEEIDAAWTNYPSDAPFIKQYLHNSAANILKKFEKANIHFVELFITDKTGLNVAVTNKTSDAYQADEDWWQTAFVAEKDKIFTSKVEYDDSAQVWGFSVYLPVYGNNGKAEGVLKGFVDLKK